MANVSQVGEAGLQEKMLVFLAGNSEQTLSNFSLRVRHKIQIIKQRRNLQSETACMQHNSGAPKESSAGCNLWRAAHLGLNHYQSCRRDTLGEGAFHLT